MVLQSTVMEGGKVNEHKYVLIMEDDNNLLDIWYPDVGVT